MVTRLRLSAPVSPVGTCRPRRAHQAPFYARELLKIIAVSESAPSAHRDVPRAGGCPTAAVPAQPETGPWFGEGSGKGLATRQAGDFLMGGASGAGSLLLNTKASQEAACSRALAAIVPGQEPESHGAGVSGNGRNGSHLAVAPVTDAAGVQVGGLGSSGNAENGSHLAEMDAAEGHTGQEAFHRERMRTGRPDAGMSGRARHARHFPPDSVVSGRL